MARLIRDERESWRNRKRTERGKRAERANDIENRIVMHVSMHVYMCKRGMKH